MNYTVWLTILMLFTALLQPAPSQRVVMRKNVTSVFQPAPADPNYRLGTLEAVTCSDTSAFFRKDSSLTTVSVSPSGNCIAAVDRSKMSMQDKHAAGVGNPLGRLPGVIYLFSRQDDGYAMSRIIRVDRETQLELSSILGAGASISWNEAETRCIVSYKWGAGSENAASVNYYHSNLYLIDLIDGTIRRLTENSEACEHCVLPAWYGPDRVRFIRLSNQGGFRNDLCEIDLETGQETTLAALYSAGGSVSVVYDWQVSWERIYYIVDAYAGGTGFYVSPFGGRESEARCLVNLMKDLRETKRQPYCTQIGRMEISANGRWACLTVVDQRVLTLDFPFADHPKKPQADPANAVSLRTGRPWVPCHNVFLYDLAAECLADPFTDAALSPDRAVVTAACFAPDGQSLLCAVFGDGQPWSVAEQTRTTFFQIDLADSDFDTDRVFETELASSLWFPEGMRWTRDNILYIPTGKVPTNPVQILRLR